MLIYFNLISAQFSNTIFSAVPQPTDITFYVRHPGEGLYHSYGNYADAAILSAENTTAAVSEDIFLLCQVAIPHLSSLLATCITYKQVSGESTGPV